VFDDDVESYQLPCHQLDLPLVLVQDSIASFESEGLCCAQQTGIHILVVEALLIAIYSTWGTSKYLYT
jgi:hypothetical protein